MYRRCKVIKNNEISRKNGQKNMDLYHFGTENRAKWYNTIEKKLGIQRYFFDT